MKRKSSLAKRIVSMVCLTAFLSSLLISMAGALIVYGNSEESIKYEIEYAANTLYNLYDKLYHGEYYYENDVLYKGAAELTEYDFNNVMRCIDCHEDVDFTIFWGEERILTTIENIDGSKAVGTVADSIVVENVLGGGLEYYYRNIPVNGQRYMGYYIPIINSSAKTVGMVFAGKPLETAYAQTSRLLFYFFVICVAVLLISFIICYGYSKRTVSALSDIREYMEEVAAGSFTAEISDDTYKRNDEIGDIAKSGVTLKNNLRIMVERDPLTMLLNRRSCRKILDEIRESGAMFCIIMGDIDFFKKINDTYGHAAGDDALRVISSHLEACAKEHGGYASRWGGEEFLLVMSGMAMAQVKVALENTAEIIRNEVFAHENGSFSVTMTFGAAMNVSGESIEDTVSRADARLYRGKKSGRNRIICNDNNVTE